MCVEERGEDGMSCPFPPPLLASTVLTTTCIYCTHTHSLSLFLSLPLSLFLSHCPYVPHHTHTVLCTCTTPPQARALWLVGACGQELQQEQWVDAWGLAVAHMGALDLVVALQAVQAVLLLAIQILDDQAILDQVLREGFGVTQNMVCCMSGV